MHKICNQGGHEACTRMGKIEEGNNKLEANGGFFAVRVFKKRSEDELKPDLRLDNIRVGIRTQPNVSKAVGGVAKGQEKAASNIPCLCLRSPKQGEPEGSFGVIRVVVANSRAKTGAHCHSASGHPPFPCLLSSLVAAAPYVLLVLPPSSSLSPYNTSSSSAVFLPISPHRYHPSLAIPINFFAWNNHASGRTPHRGPSAAGYILPYDEDDKAWPPIP